MPTGKYLTQMLETGWAVIIADPSISLAAFLAAIAPTWAQADWEDGYTILTELGYFSGSENWAQQKTWVTDKTVEQVKFILRLLKGSGTVSPTLDLRLREAQRDILQDQRDVVHAEITEALNPFLLTPPSGLDQRVFDAVAAHQVRQQGVRAGLDDRIAALGLT